MKMYDKNGNYSIVARAIFEANMKRLREGQSVHDIARSMKEQVAILEYNGPLLEGGVPVIRYWEIYRRGLKWNPVHQAQEGLKHFSKVLYSGTNYINQMFPQEPLFPILDVEYDRIRNHYVYKRPSTTQPIVISGSMNA